MRKKWNLSFCINSTKNQNFGKVLSKILAKKINTRELIGLTHNFQIFDLVL